MEALVGPSPQFWSRKRVLLTGHTGFKGSWLALWLELLGAEVYGLALDPVIPLSSPPLWDALGCPGGKNSMGDIRSQAAVNEAFERSKPDILLHLAAQALVHPSYDDPVTTYETNVMGLVNVLEAARRCPTLKSIVVVTSDKCYENREQLWAYRENEPMGGSDPYSASKGCAELITASYRRSFFNNPDGALLASARAGNVIGGGDWSVDRLVPDCIRAFQAGEAVAIRNPHSTRPWQHVLEPLSGYLVLAEMVTTHGSRYAEGWNFGPSDDDAWPVHRIVETLAGCWGEGATWTKDATPRPHEAMLLRVDASKARSMLGWSPRMRISDGLRWTVDWHRSVSAGECARTITMGQIAEFEALNGVSR